MMRPAFRLLHHSPFLPILLFALLGFGAARADLIKEGETPIPQGGGKVVKWRCGYKKSPGAGKSVHFWFDMTLKDPVPADDVTFVVCAMINIDKPKIDMPAYKANLGGGVWTCVANGIVNWYPNYHFGCKRVTLNAGNGWHDNTSFDKTVNLSQDFVSADLVSPYLDFAVDCPGGFIGCGPLFDKPDVFLTPGDGVGPTGTSSWWVVTDGNPPTGPIVSGSDGWNTGNWYSMGYVFNNYVSRLDGTVTGLPGGALVTFSFPPSTGGGVHTFEVPGAGCAGETLRVSLPFVINDALMQESDESTHMRFSFSDQNCSQDPNGRVIEFVGQVVATDYSYFPDHRILYAPGDFMYGVHVQHVIESDAPYVVDQVFGVGPGGGCLVLRAADPSTMAIAATLRRTLGTQVDDMPMPYDSPSADGMITRFRIPFTPMPGASYQVMLVDDAGNANAATLDASDFVMPPDRSTLRLVSANPSSGSFRLEFALPAESPARVEIFDLSGRRVRILHQGRAGAGRHALIWDVMDERGHAAPAGLYLARLTTPERSVELRLARMR